MVGKNRFVNFALVLPPEDAATDRYSQLLYPTSPQKMRKQLQTQNRGTIYHGQWQRDRKATNQSAHEVLDQPMIGPLGRHHFSTLPAIADPGRVKSTLSKSDLATSTVGIPVMARFMPSALARKLAASIKKKTSSFTTKEFEQFSPGAEKSNPKDEISGVRIPQHEREVKALATKNVERLFLTVTKENSKRRTLVNHSLPNRPIAQTEEVKWSPRKANKDKVSAKKKDFELFPPKAKPKDKPSTKKECLEVFSQGRTKAEPRHKSRSMKFPYLNNQMKDDPELFPSKAAKTKPKGKKPGAGKSGYKSELSSNPGKDTGSEDKVLSWGGPAPIVKQVKELLAIDAKVRSTPQDNLVELQGTADTLFEDLICIPDQNPPYTPLRYQIDASSLLKKRILKDESINKAWSHQLYQSNGKLVQVHYCKTFETADDIAKLFIKDTVIGFDMEWLSCSIKSESPRYHGLMHIISRDHHNR